MLYLRKPTSLLIVLLLGCNTHQELFPLLFDLAVISEVGTGSLPAKLLQVELCVITF